MDHQQNFAVLSLTQRNPTLLRLAVFSIGNGNHQGITEYRSGQVKTDAMFAPVAGGLGGIGIPIKVKSKH